MSLLIALDKTISTQEIVICDSDMAAKTHKRLFLFKDSAYTTLPFVCNNYKREQSKNIETTEIFLADISKILHSCGSPLNLHFVLNWEHMLQIALWSIKNPSTKDALQLFSTTGMRRDELLDIELFNIYDIFKHLLYKKRFDIFRKICHYAKVQLTNQLTDRSILVISFLFSPITDTIVASSL